MGDSGLVRRRALGIGAATLLAAILLVFWFGGRPAFLEVALFPGGEIRIDGDRHVDMFRGEVEPGRLTIEASRARFQPQNRQLELGAGDSVHVAVHLLPRDPFDRKALEAMAQAYGGRKLFVLSAGKPRGTGGRAAKVAPGDAEVVALRLERLPQEVRTRPEGLYLAIDGLLHDELYAEAYTAALRLAADHRDRPGPLALALEALQRLGQADTTTYRDLFEQYAKRGGA